jgi:hypothetical protein
MVDENKFLTADWKSFYPDTQKIPPNAPKPLGNDILVSCFVNADHADNQITQRSHTDIIIFCNRAPMVSYYKY